MSTVAVIGVGSMGSRIARRPWPSPPPGRRRVALLLAEAARTWLADAEAVGLGERDYSAVLGRILGRRA